MTAILWSFTELQGKYLKEKKMLGNCWKPIYPHSHKSRYHPEVETA